MTATIYFLEAGVPLTKTFSVAEDGSIDKDAYPLVANFTSHTEKVKDPIQLMHVIEQHAEKGHCLLKGALTRELTKESRRGTTRTDDATKWICLDFDRRKCESVDHALSMMGLGDISYVLQYSASHGLPGTEGTVSAHVFMLLDKELPAPFLKTWLMDLNLKYMHDGEGGISLSRSRTVLSWPLDVTTCQNDKLLYIAPPKFIGMKDPLKEPRIQLVPKKLKALPTSRIANEDSRDPSAIQADARRVLNELRKAVGLPARTAKTTWVGTCEVLNKPDACTVTGKKDCGEFVRLNINGGDSWAYWHSKDNFELIHDFKSDAWYRTKELVPGYYQELINDRAALNETPTEDGDLILAFRDLKTSQYFNGYWNPSEQKLRYYGARDVRQLEDWMRSHGRILGDFVPIWEIDYDPRGDWIVDEENHRINTFISTSYMKGTPIPDRTYEDFPTIHGIIKHMLGEAVGDNELSDHFINWFACIFQRKHKPLTAWVTHGTEGTGKGYFIKRIAGRLLGMVTDRENCFMTRVANIEDSFNGWLENRLLVFVDEVDVDDFREKGRVTASLRNYITESTISIRKMRQQAVNRRNYASFIFSSNRPQPVFIPEGDRRYNVGNFQPMKLKPPKDDVVDAELMRFAEFLLAHKADVKQADDVLHTEARARIQRLSGTSIDETCRAIREGDFDALWMAMPDEALMNSTGIVNAHTQTAQAYCILMRNLLNDALVQPSNVLSRDELQLILQYNVGNMPPTPNKFTSLLRHHGIETKQVRRNGIKTYGIDVRWVISDELRAEISTAPKASKLRKIK